MLQVGAIGEKEGWTSSGMGSAARGEREGLSIVITVSITGFVYNLIIVRKKNPYVSPFITRCMESFSY